LKFFLINIELFSIFMLFCHSVQCTLYLLMLYSEMDKNNAHSAVLQVCVRCILRLLGAYSSACSHASLTASALHSFLEEHDDSIKGGSCPCLSMNDAYCSVCLGVLLPAFHRDEGLETPNGISHIDNISSMISQVVQRESYQVDEFSLEISLPPVIAANERAVR
jgi:tRNA pseudouridine synthase 10